MKFCSTCGRPLRSTDVFTVNGIEQCEQCAYPNVTVPSAPSPNAPHPAAMYRPVPVKPQPMPANPQQPVAPRPMPMNPQAPVNPQPVPNNYGYAPVNPAPQRPAPPQQPSVADELLKFKQLLDMGAITQEEFDAMKKQLLKL